MLLKKKSKHLFFNFNSFINNIKAALDLSTLTSLDLSCTQVISIGKDTLANTIKLTTIDIKTDYYCLKSKNG